VKSWTGSSATRSARAFPFSKPLIGCLENRRRINVAHFPEHKTLETFDWKLRAETEGRGDGRIYGNIVTCEDTAGNQTNGITLVTVPHDQRDRP